MKIIITSIIASIVTFAIFPWALWFFVKYTIYVGKALGMV